MKKIKKLFLIVFVLCFALSAINVYALPNTSVESKLREEYIEQVLPHYLATEGARLYSNIKISNPFPILNNPDNQARLYFITENDSYIAQLVVTKINNKFYSSFMFDHNSNIDTVFANNEALGLVTIDDGILILQTADNNYTISNPNRSFISNDQQVVPSCDLMSVSFTNYTGCINSNNLSRDYYVSLNVRHVNNATVNGAGLCWAACISAVSNYRMGTNYNAIGLYNELYELYNEVPCGTDLWYYRGYAHCRMICTCTSGMSFTETLIPYSSFSDKNA